MSEQSAPNRHIGWYFASCLTLLAVAIFAPHITGVSPSIIVAPALLLAIFWGAAAFLRFAAKPTFGQDSDGVAQRRKFKIYSLTLRHMAWLQFVVVGGAAVSLAADALTIWLWVLAVASCGVVLLIVIGERRANLEAEEELEEKNPLKWGLVYWDPADKRVLIPWDDWNMRFNWGNPVTWIVVPLFFSFLLIPAVLVIVTL